MTKLHLKCICTHVCVSQDFRQQAVAAVRSLVSPAVVCVGFAFYRRSIQKIEGEIYAQQ